MRVLLLGEFSGLHKNLKEGLCYLGHDVNVASTGDGWKNIACDIDLSVEGRGFLAKIKRRIKLASFFLSCKGYDVVQIVNADIFSISFFPNKIMLRRLKKKNSRVFLLAAGDDAFFWKYGRKYLKYGPFDDALKYDLKKDRSPYESKYKYLNNRYIVSQVDGVIPIMYEYKVSYQLYSRILPVIPIPINLQAITYIEHRVNEKLTVFHGLNRYGFKGTCYVEKAFEVLKEKYPDVDFLIKGKMPLNKYIDLMEKTNIVIDQTSSYSLGVNGLLAMSMGKVVLGGAERESLECFGINSSPVINILPDVDDIVRKVSRVIDLNENEFKALSKESRKYVEQHHDYIKIAKRYIENWSI